MSENWIAARQFRILFENAVDDGLRCPPSEFQPDKWEGCRTPQSATDDLCMTCWANYTRLQSLLDLGLMEKRVDKALNIYLGACKYEEEKNRGD